MLVKTIVVSATRKVPHPTEEYASLSALVSIEADVAANEDYIHCIQLLQVNAEDEVDRHLRRLTANISARDRKDREAERAQKATEGKANLLAAKHSREKF